ncbi:MAG: aldehyde dehydrogenase family protein [Arenicellales bacterium]|nr:aldehyde dehydrogenase family protein [Arenicellales bacterium]
MTRTGDWSIPEDLPETMMVGGGMIETIDPASGQVFIDQYFAGAIATPFGGTKNSGFGREKELAALASYYQIKCVTARI